MVKSRKRLFQQQLELRDEYKIFEDSPWDLGGRGAPRPEAVRVSFSRGYRGVWGREVWLRLSSIFDQCREVKS